MKDQILLSIICIIFSLSVFSVSGEVMETGEEITVFTEPVSQEVTDYLIGTIELDSGWNFVSIPRRLAKEVNTASIFNGLDSAGHSIWTYNQKDGGWNDLTAEDRILPLEGYWVYSTGSFTVPLSFSDDPLQVPPVRT